MRGKRARFDSTHQIPEIRKSKDPNSKNQVSRTKTEVLNFLSHLEFGS
jgi:hypothetical protein